MNAVVVPSRGTVFICVVVASRDRVFRLELGKRVGDALFFLSDLLCARGHLLCATPIYSFQHLWAPSLGKSRLGSHS